MRNKILLINPATDAVAMDLERSGPFSSLKLPPVQQQGIFDPQGSIVFLITRQS
jgi:hypothetical protein